MSLSEKRGEVSKTAPVDRSLDFIEQIRRELDQLKKEKDEGEKKAAEYLDKLTRLQADMENLQRITKRQMETMTRQASERLLLKLLPILDALRQAGNIAHSNNELPRQEMALGLNMLLEELTDVLGTEGLEEIPALGQSLDPQKHEAVSFIETNEKPENTIMEEIRKGYALNGRVIRPSLVVVSKPKKSKEKEANDASEK